MDANNPTHSVEPRELIRPVLSRWWLVLAITTLVTAAVYYYYETRPDRYTASTVVLIEQSTLSSSLTGASVAFGDPDRIARNEATLLQSDEVASRVAKQIGFQGDPEALLGSLAVKPVEDTDFLEIRATTGNPRTAAALANGFAAAFADLRADESRNEARDAIQVLTGQLKEIPPSSAAAPQRQSLQTRIERLEVIEQLPPAGARQLNRAEPPTAPDGSNPIRNAMFGFAVALVLGIAAAYALEFLDRRLKTAADVASLFGKPLIARLPHVKSTMDEKDGKAAVATELVEGFRALRTNVQMLAGSHGNGELRSLLVTSALAGEGKSTVARNLALSFSEIGVDVLLVDSDLRNPSLLTDSREQPGLIELVAGQVSLEAAIQHVPVYSEGLTLVDSSPQPRATPVAATAPAGGGSTATRPALTAALRRGRRGDVETSRVAEAGTNTHPAAGSIPARNGAGARLSVLGTGSAPVDPAALLGSDAFRRVVRQLESRYSVVIFDSSPVLPVSDAIPMMSAVDGILITARLGTITRTAGRELAETIARVDGAEVLGVIANDMKQSEGLPRYGYYESATRTDADDE